MAGIFQSRLFIAAAAATITAVVVGGVAWAAQSPVDGAGVVHACYNATTGSVIMNVTGACPKKGETTPITWNAQGVPGTNGTNGQSVTGAPLPTGDAHCPNGGSQFAAANGTTYACNGADGAPGPAGGVALSDYCDTALRVDAKDQGGWPPVCDQFAPHVSAAMTVAATNDADASGTLTVGDTVLWTITATNAGPGTANNVQVAVGFATGSPGHITTTVGTIDATCDEVCVHVPTLTAGQSVVVTVSEKVTSLSGITGLPGMFIDRNALVSATNAPLTGTTDPTPPPGGCGAGTSTCLPIGSPI
jgi:hypothetical protein